MFVKHRTHKACTPSQLFKYSRTPFLLTCLLLMGVSCVTPPPPLVGSWVNTEYGSRVQLDFLNQTDCTLTLARTFSSSKVFECQYERFDHAVEIYFKGADGQCGSTADLSANINKNYSSLTLDLQPLPIELFPVNP